MKYLIYIAVFMLCGSVEAADDSLWLSGTADIEDTWIRSSGAAATNYGSADTLIIGLSGSDTSYIMVRTPYLADSVPGGKILKSYTVQLYTKQLFSGGVMDAHFVMKPFEEPKATWNSWRHEAISPLRREWGVSGARDTGSVMNDDDEAGDDRNGDTVGSANHPATGNWVDVAIDTGWINDHWFSTPADSNRGIIIVAQDGDFQLASYWASEKTGADSTKSIRVKIVWGDADAGGPPNVIHGPDGSGIRHSSSGASVRHGP